MRARGRPLRDTHVVIIGYETDGEDERLFMAEEGELKRLGDKK